MWDDAGNRVRRRPGQPLVLQRRPRPGRDRRRRGRPDARDSARFHTFDRFTNEPAERLPQVLGDRAPFPDARVFYTSSGSEAVESAIKLARLTHWVAGDRERHVVISRAPSYHGVTYRRPWP